MKIKSIIVILVLICILLFSGCTSKEEQTDRDRAIEDCTNECKSWLNSGKNLSDGPCLLNSIPDLPDWVCDVAHQPRQDVDNIKENQCSEYEKTANHFVEVDPDCKFIRVF